jgi:hypothetical protein
MLEPKSIGQRIRNDVSSLLTVEEALAGLLVANQESARAQCWGESVSLSDSTAPQMFTAMRPGASLRFCGIDTTCFQNRHENASIYRFPLFVIVAIKQLNPRD